MKPNTYVTYQELSDMANALSFTNLKADRRVQLKMPGKIVDLLDKEFPHIDRSKLLTQAAIEILMRKLRFPEPEIRELVDQEQQGLDDMWDYLEERERE